MGAKIKGRSVPKHQDSFERNQTEKGEIPVTILVKMTSVKVPTVS